MIVPGYLSAKSLHETDPATGEHRVWFSHPALEGHLKSLTRLERALVWKSVDAVVEKRVRCLLPMPFGAVLVVRFSRLLGDSLGRAHSRVEAFLADADQARTFCAGVLSLEPQMESAEFDVSGDSRIGSRAVGESLVLDDLEFEVFDDRADCYFNGARRRECLAEPSLRLDSEPKATQSSRKNVWILILALMAILALGYALNLAHELTLVERSLEEARQELIELRQQVLPPE